MAHCVSLYLCSRDGADIPKRGRGGDFKVSNLTSAALRHGRKYRHSCGAVEIRKLESVANSFQGQSSVIVSSDLARGIP